jgi:hypothetical protein
MSDEPKEKSNSSVTSGLGFIDSIVDGFRTVGNTLQVQNLLDDAFYMATKYALQVLLGAATKFKVDGKVDDIANRGVILATLATSPADIVMMTQAVSKRLTFVVDKQHTETPVLKSFLKSMSVIATLDEMVSNEKDPEIYQWIRTDRKILAVVVDEKLDRETIVKAFEKTLRLARDGFCPVIPVGISGTNEIKPGATITVKIGDRVGVNQKVADDEIEAMANDLIDRLHALKQA